MFPKRLTGRLSEVFSAMKLDQIFDIWDSEQDALKAFAQGQAVSAGQFSGPA